MRVELDAVAEQPGEVGLGAPARRGLRAGRRRRGERRERTEQRADHALGGPAQQPDGAAAPGRALQLAGGRGVVGREHRADRRDHDVEGLVGEREVLGVALDPVELEAGSPRAAPSRLEQLGRQVERGHDGARGGGRQRGVARARGDVEHRLPRLDAGRFDDAVAERQQPGLHHRGVVAGRPDRAVAGLELRIS